MGRKRTFAEKKKGRIFKEAECEMRGRGLLRGGATETTLF